jgi:8-oxo-dGTP diphosphatase
MHWGRRGAAGLLVADRGRVLLQLRARWAHQGGTWSIPGGARERGETALQAALREAHEEMAIDRREVEVRSSYVASCGGWEYETVLAVAAGPVQLAHGSESVAHVWAAADEVAGLPLHPAFREAWDATDGELRAFVAATA